MKRGSYLVNTARGKICDAAAVAEACESGQLAGYAGDVWFPQPPPADHPWRSMPRNAMTPHVSGTSLSAQARYAAGVREILEYLFRTWKIMKRCNLCLDLTFQSLKYSNTCSFPNIPFWSNQEVKALCESIWKTAVQLEFWVQSLMVAPKRICLSTEVFPVTASNSGGVPHCTRWSACWNGQTQLHWRPDDEHGVTRVAVRET